MSATKLKFENNYNATPDRRFSFYAYDNPFYDDDVVLGIGTSGVVYRGRCNLTGALVAIKIVYIPPNKRVKTATHPEIVINRILDHPNIVKCLAVYKDEQYMTFVFERMTGGTLDALIKRDYKFGMPEFKAKAIFLQIVDAFKHLVHNKVMHRDVKPENIMMTKEKRKKAAVPKLMDFGLSTFYDNEEFVSNDKKGTPLYSSPEVICFGPYGTNADVWSLGMVFLEMLIGCNPFYSAVTEEELLDMATRPDFYTLPHEISSSARNLLKGMLCIDAKRRLTFKQLFEHAYLQPEIIGVLVQPDYIVPPTDMILGSVRDMVSKQADTILNL